ncbi:unnamed protein product [Linum tenue]|uniref:C2H2-type domain-containing protein n=1 Tax=Linum tenue TaxID=586396 RepID=A0AAV0KA03_9ROSI|nr:unnamed protein product [Linum tenue]
MAAELGFLALTQLQKHHQRYQHQQQLMLMSDGGTNSSTGAAAAIAGVPPRTTWMWNPRPEDEEDDDDEEESWEVKAFEEDAGNVNGSTWPPRSYTCTFCRREFRSAQALGGHMNVHRRDRAKLHHHQALPLHLPPPPPPPQNPTNASSSSTYIIPSPEFSAAAGGLCLLYQFPSPNNLHHPITTATFSTVTNACTTTDAPSTLLSMAPYAQEHRYSRRGPMVAVGQSRNPYPPPVRRNSSSSSPPQYYNFGAGGGGQLATAEGNDKEMGSSSNEEGEELDLELRLGQRSTSSSSSS